MAAPTEEDLDKKRQNNEKLRAQLAETQQKAAAAAYEQGLVVQGAQLDAETAALEAQLSAAKEAAKVSNIKAGASGPLDQAAEAAKAASAGTTPPGVTVEPDTAGDDSSTKDGE